MRTLALCLLALRFTAPATRDSLPCDPATRIPAMGGHVVFVQFFAFNWTRPAPWIYQQVRATPGQRYALALPATPGTYGVFCRTISERGYRNCADTSIVAEAQ